MKPVSPSAHDTVTSVPSGIVSSALPVPTTAGTPSSRAMIAAWQVRPPRLVTIAAARFITGSQSGSVMSATSTSPGWTRFMSLIERITRALPAPIFWPIERPSASTSARACCVSLELEAFDLRRASARLHRFRARLHDVELAGGAVLRPFDIHRTPVVLLDHERLLRELVHVGIVEAELRAIGRGRLLDAHALAGLVDEYTMRCCFAPSWRRRIAGLPARSVGLKT